jgi:polyribonucleotide nucleotidyltransferase
LQRQLVASVIATRGPIEPLKYTPVLDYTDELFAAVEVLQPQHCSQQFAIASEERSQRSNRCSNCRDTHCTCGSSEVPGAFAGQEKQIKEAVRSLTKKLVRKRVVERRHAHRRSWPCDLRPVSQKLASSQPHTEPDLFQRGETQVLNVLHHGNAEDEPDDRLDHP